MVKIEIMPSGCDQINPKVNPWFIEVLTGKAYQYHFFENQIYSLMGVADLFRPHDFNLRQDVMLAAKIKQFLRFTAESENFSASFRLIGRKCRAIQQSRFDL